MKRSTVLALAVAAVLAGGLTTARLFADDGAKPPVAPAPTTKEDKVRRLLSLNGVEAEAASMIDAMLRRIETARETPPGFAAKFRERANVKDIVELTIPAYAKHLDDATLDASIVFYESPAGRNLVAQLPAITVEAAKAGAVWGRNVVAEIQKELAEGGGKTK
jgi:hypothetical protein